jgi:Chaperone for flagella basal body P-ring formation
MQHGWKMLGAVLVGSSIPVAFAQGRQAAHGDDVVHVLDDGATGDRWMLERNVGHPGGPGRLTQVAGDGARSDRDPKPANQLVIHAGETVSVQEVTKVVSVRLIGVAQASAARGKAVNVRLVVNGRFVRAIAEAPGRVRLIAWEVR